MTKVADVQEEQQYSQVELNKDLCPKDEYATGVIAIAERTASPGGKAVRIRSLSKTETIKAIIADTSGCCW
jgi:hypothetical protein